MALEPNDPTTEALDELRIVVGVDGSAYATRAVEWRRVTFWEGDLLHKLGASRRTEHLTREELTTEAVTQRGMGVLRRAVSHGDLSEVVAQ